VPRRPGTASTDTDFLLDEQTLAIQPFTAAADEKNGIKGDAKGQRRCIVVVPKEVAAGSPGPGAAATGIISLKPKSKLLNRGFHIAYITANAELRRTKNGMRGTHFSPSGMACRETRLHRHEPRR